MKNRRVSSILIPTIAVRFFAALDVGLVGFASIGWLGLPMIAGCSVMSGIAVFAFRDHSSAPSYRTSNKRRLVPEDCAHAGAPDQVELGAA